MSPPHGALLTVALFGLFSRAQLSRYGVSVGGGTTGPTDMLLGATMAGHIANVLIAPCRRSLRPLLYWPLLLVLAMATFAAGYAVLRGVDMSWIVIEYRQLLNLALAFPLAHGLRSSKKFALTMLIGLYIVALACSLMLIWEYLNGQGSAALFSDGGIRVDGETIAFPMLAVVWTFCLMPSIRARWLRRMLSLAALLMGLGIIVTFLRGAWIALVVGLIAAFVTVPELRRLRHLLGVASVVAVLSLAAAVISSGGSGGGSLFTSVVARASSVGESTDVSTQYRLAENNAAMAALRRQPVLGYGLGSDVRFVNPMYSDEFQVYNAGFSTVYLHNSWIWLGVKLGVGGLLAYAALILGALRLSWGQARQFTSQRRHVFAAVFSSFVTLLAFGFFGPHLTIETSTAAIAALLACCALAPASRDA